MGRVHNSTNSVNPLIIGGKQPLDVRTVVQTSEDLTTKTIMSSAYKGMIVYVTGIVDGVQVEDPFLYICHKEAKSLTNVEDGWKKLDIDYSVRIVETEDNLIDGATIKFPYQGMMAYVTSNDSLYILLSKGIANAKEINNWKKISVTPSSTLDKVGINVAPEGGSGFMIAENKDVIIEDYVNVENYIKAKYFYTSKGVNSYDKEFDFPYDSLRLSKGGNSYIELYTKGDNWIAINDPDNSLGLSELSGKTITKEMTICFGVDIKFTDGWTISYGDVSRPFADNDYELVDIYRSEYSPEVYAYLKDIDVRVLTEDDLIAIDDKFNNIANSIMIDLESGSDSDSDEEAIPLQQVIVKMNNSITKLELNKVEPDTIDHTEIDELFS